MRTVLIIIQTNGKRSDESWVCRHFISNLMFNRCRYRFFLVTPIVPPRQYFWLEGAPPNSRPSDESAKYFHGEESSQLNSVQSPEMRSGMSQFPRESILAFTWNLVICKSGDRLWLIRSSRTPLMHHDDNFSFLDILNMRSPWLIQMRRHNTLGFDRVRVVMDVFKYDG